MDERRERHCRRAGRQERHDVWVQMPPVRSRKAVSRIRLNVHIEPA